MRKITDLEDFKKSKSDVGYFTDCTQDDTPEGAFPFVATHEGRVVLVSHPLERKGVALTPDQARDLGCFLIEQAGMAELKS